MNANVEDRGIKGDCTPLMEAASAGHVEIVSLLIAHGADVNAQSTSGETRMIFLYSTLLAILSESKLNLAFCNELSDLGYFRLNVVSSVQIFSHD